MNMLEKSKSIKAGLRQGFQEGSSKMAKRRCYGYTTASDGEIVVNSDEAQVVCWIFERYLAGDSLGKIASGLEQQGIPSPTGKSKWNREAIDKLLSNEKYTGRVLLQKTISTGISKLKTMASWIGISTPAPMRPLFLTRCSWPYSRRNSLVPKILKRRLQCVSLSDSTLKASKHCNKILPPAGPIPSFVALCEYNF